MNKQRTALIFSTLLMATGAQAQWEGNWLLGVSAGGAWHNNHDNNVTVTFSDNIGSDSFSINHNNDGEDHFIWGFLAGYQARCCNWLVGLEVNVDWRGNDDDINFSTPQRVFRATSWDVSRDRDAVWGITGRFGYYVYSCLMPYIRLGADWGKKDFNFFATTADNALPIITASADNDSNSRWGFVGGIGLEWFMPMMPCLSLRAEWDYHSRRHHHDDVSALASNGVTLFTINGGGDRHENTAIASLVYNFSI